ncbi:MAG: nitroreductase family protein [Bacillota bacterium]|nr:nitroreductase family protein [Bacillota bacterium]
MNESVNYYDAVFKRKSFHLFRGVGDDSITQEELNAIESAYSAFDCLYSDIKTAIRIVPAEAVNFKRDAEYCILIYSEKKENYLINAGYIGEQLDLWLVDHNIGSLWFGIGKPDEPIFNGLEYVIMIAIHKVNDETKYRKDMFKAKRKPMDEIWSGDDLGIANIVRFAPSACNTQPWYVNNSGGKLTVYRYKKAGKRGIMPAASVSYYNRIDIGIFLCILEICMINKSIGYTRTLFIDDGSDSELTKAAEYAIKKK